MIGAAELEGHWRRDWIRVGGGQDDATRVHWLQAPEGYCDLRVPADLPDLGGARALAELETGHLLQLTACEGFAGTIAAAGGLCTWHRRINLHGETAFPDIGRLWHDGAGRLVEDGLAAAYRELWSVVDRGPYRRRVWVAEGAELHAVWSDERFAYGIGRPGMAATSGLRAALARGERPEDGLAVFFASEFGMGRWSADGAEGIVTLCTNPLREGAHLAARQALEGGELSIERPDFAGRAVVTAWQPTRLAGR